MDKDLQPTAQASDQQAAASAASVARPERRRTVFSIKSIMVITAVFAASAVSLGHLWRAANGNESEIGNFAILNAMLPMLVLVAASWFFKIFGRFIR